MALATSSKKNEPGVRFVLLKGVDERGLIFFSDYTSPKGRDLSVNPRAEAAFFWPGDKRQVRINGAVEKISPAESDAYFNTRSRLSRAAVIAYRQSRTIPFETDLRQVCHEFLRGNRGKALTRPPEWGGYRLVPWSIEFWRAREYRLHDRFLYSRKGEGGRWRILRLSP